MDENYSVLLRRDLRLGGGEAKALVKQLDNQEYPGLVTVKTSSGELTVNLTENTSFALHRRKSMRIM